MSGSTRAVDSPGSARAVGAGGLPVVKLRAGDGATADVYLHGAHVTSWRPAPDGEERLFLSERSVFRAGVAIRGGIPVIFPQFAAEGPLPRHGFARTMTWSLDGVEQTTAGEAVATLGLRDSAATRSIWAAEFHATITVRVGGARLLVALEVANTGPASFAFTCALHTYLRVRDVADAVITGLTGTRYRVSSAPTLLRRDDAEVVRVTGELDRVYVDAPRTLTLRESARALAIETDAFPDVVVWHPGADRAAALPDMESDGARSMLCVEAAVVQTPLTLAPGARWRGAQALTERS